MADEPDDDFDTGLSPGGGQAGEQAEGVTDEPQPDRRPQKGPDGRFLLGNKLGPRFKPGQSGNPRGSLSRRKMFEQMLEKLGDKLVSELGMPTTPAIYEGLTVDEAFALRATIQALASKDIRWAQFYSEQKHGRLPYVVKPDQDDGLDESLTDLRLEIVETGSQAEPVNGEAEAQALDAPRTVDIEYKVVPPADGGNGGGGSDGKK